MSDMVYPIRPWGEARISTEFLDPRYREWRERRGLSPAEHPGIDINIGPTGYADLGYPVRAVYSGLVVHAGFHKVWGNVVLIWHPGLRAWTQYAHLLRVSVREGDRVCPGEDIGSIGQGDPARPFSPHLHFEVRIKDLPADHWPGENVEEIRAAYLDPRHLFRKFAARDRIECHRR